MTFRKLPVTRRRRGTAGISEVPGLIEILESRQLLSAVPALAVSKAFALPTVVLMGGPGANGNGILPAVNPIAGISPSQMLTAYGVNLISFGSVPGTGAGQTIAIVDAFNDPNIVADTNSFSQTFGLPQFNISGGPTLQVLNENGGTSLPANDTGDNWALEESLDVEWAHAIAPKANIILFEASSAGPIDLYTAAKTAAGTPRVSVVSMSWGAAEFSYEASYDSYFTTPVGHAGVTFLASAGDSAAPAEYPAFSPNVVAVGGTTLTLNAINSYASESAWARGGGGISQFESQPAYQNEKVNGTSSSFRTAPDVAMDAGSTVAVLDSYNSGWTTAGGTSLASSMWTGLIAIADQGLAINGVVPLDGASQTLPTLYNLPSPDFHDITTGNNGSAATPGYDLATGLGTPIANLIVPDIVAKYSGTSQAPSITSANKATFTAGTASSFTVAATGTPSPTFGESGSLPADLVFNSATGVLSGTPAAGTGGTYKITFTASNGVGSPTTQNFTLTVDEAPNITSTNSATFTVGTSGSFSLTATGFPAPRLGVAGALPAGLTFDPSTGVFSGTPSPGTVGGYSLLVTASNGVGQQLTNFSLTVQAAQPSKLVLLSSPVSGTAGQALSPSLTVAVEDAFGDVVTDDSSTVTIAVSAGPTRLSADSITSAVAVDGIATFSSLLLDAAGTYRLGVADGSLTGATSATITIGAGAASKLFVSDAPVFATAGQALNPGVTVGVQDAFGNAVTSDTSTITLSVTSGPAGFASGSTTSTVAVNGVATFSNLILGAAGPYTLIATAGSLASSTSTSITVNPATASKLFVSDAPVFATAGQALNPGVTVGVQDAFGNAVTFDTSTITLSVSSGPAGFASGSSTSAVAVNGVAMFSDLILDAAGPYTLIATAGSLASGTSTSITVNPATASKLFVSDAPVFATAGQALNPGVTVVVQDAFGNAVTSDTSAITLSVSSGPAGFASGSSTSAVAVNGVATFSNLILDTAGSYTLNASDGSLAAALSTSITVNA
ncbi:MAG TPA: putative Ig domain-containing protein [Planctomycetaceae bacterium]|jgi:hypothetical protein|nr:putative Ig domain-containing protein [Planctomycetaceae bacterium]